MLVKIISISILLSFTKAVSQTISFEANTEATSIGAVTKSRYGTISCLKTLIVIMIMTC